MDTRFWGPSGWQLIHLIAFRSHHPQEFLLGIKDILPCRFCRESTAQFTHELPMMKDTGKWAYELHNKVNHKLRTQSKDDPSVINPGEDPSFEEVKQKYMEMKPTNVPGRDFLFSIAINYPDEPKEIDMATQRTFIHKLSEVYPFKNLQKRFYSYLRNNEVALSSRHAYMKWMYGLLNELSDEIKVDIPSYKGYVSRVMYFKSGCQKKTYRGKTCRKMPNGYRTKDRDHKRTFRITRQSLLNG
jgi:hypothetical protein